MPPTLKILIVPLPKGATSVDTYLARTIQSLVYMRDENNSTLSILFIPWESHQQIMRYFYKIDNGVVI
jgi:hypothetical protein